MSTPSAASNLPRRRSGVEVSRALDQNVLVDPSGHRTIANDTALALWELCDGQTDLEEMIDAVCALFRVDREVAAADVRATLDHFAELELIHW